MRRAFGRNTTATFEQYDGPYSYDYMPRDGMYYGEANPDRRVRLRASHLDIEDYGEVADPGVYVRTRMSGPGIGDRRRGFQGLRKRKK